MIITYEGVSYPFDFEDIGVKQGIAIEKHTGLPFADWGSALEKGGNLLALQAVGWLILDHGDLDRPIADCNFKMARLGAAFAAAVTAEAEAEAAKSGPTPAAAMPGGAEGNGSAAADGPLSGSVSALT